MRAFTIKLSDVGRCPNQRLDVEHYREDGTCRHVPDQREERTVSRIFQVLVRCEGDAFGDLPETEVARILRATADRVELGEDSQGTLLDLNGNTAGGWRFAEASPAPWSLRLDDEGAQWRTEEGQ